jgi:hypothetical protein
MAGPVQIRKGRKDGEIRSISGGLGFRVSWAYILIIR